MRKRGLTIAATGGVLAGLFLMSTAVQAGDPTGLVVQAQAAKGAAAPGNDEPADFLVLVTRPTSGAAVVGLVQSNFGITNHFGVPGQACGFSNNIVSFVDVGTGAYRIQVALGCGTWVTGDNLAQVSVTSVAPGGPRRGQAAATLRVF